MQQEDPWLWLPPRGFGFGVGLGLRGRHEDKLLAQKVFRAASKRAIQHGRFR